MALDASPNQIGVGAVVVLYIIPSKMGPTFCVHNALLVPPRETYATFRFQERSRSNFQSFRDVLGCRTYRFAFCSLLTDRSSAIAAELTVQHTAVQLLVQRTASLVASRVAYSAASCAASCALSCAATVCTQ